MRVMVAKVLYCDGGEFCPHDYGCPDEMSDPLLDLPDAEHIHLHRLPDGRWTAVAMRPTPFVTTCVTHGGVYTVSVRGDALMDGACSQARRGDPPCEWRLCWADVPAAPEQDGDR